MGKSISEVLTALTLCGANYWADSCKACPLNDSCKPGDNAALVDAATEAITDLVAFNALCLQEKAGLLQVLKHARVTVYVVVHRRRSTRDVFTLKTGLFRPNDLKRLGKTVFLNRGEAEKELRRLQELWISKRNASQRHTFVHSQRGTGFCFSLDGNHFESVGHAEEKAKRDCVNGGLTNVMDKVSAAVEDCGKSMTKDIRQASPKRTGAYKKGWRCEIKRNGRGSTTATAKNATNYQLTHLLEYPHKKRGHKGIVQPKKHIQPAADKWQAEFEHRCEEACKAK